MKTLTIKIPEPTEVEYSTECLEEHLSVRGNAMCSGNDEYDKQVKDEILTELE